MRLHCRRNDSEHTIANEEITIRELYSNNAGGRVCCTFCTVFPADYDLQ